MCKIDSRPAKSRSEGQEENQGRSLRREGSVHYAGDNDSAGVEQVYERRRREIYGRRIVDKGERFREPSLLTANISTKDGTTL